MLGLLLTAVFALGLQISPGQVARPGQNTLSLDAVLEMVRADLTEDLIVARVKRNNKAFELNSEEIVELRRSGVSDTVIKLLLDPSLPYSPPNQVVPLLAPSPVAAPPKPPEDLLSLKVPAEPGGYWLRAGEVFVKLGLKPVMPANQGSKLVSVLTGGLKKGQTVGVLVGISARTRVAQGSCTFYFRLPESQSIEDLILLAVETSDGGRHLNFGPSPSKPAFPVASVRAFEWKEAGPGLSRINLTFKDAGEYAFYVMGSGDEKRGTLGKAYEVGVD